MKRALVLILLVLMVAAPCMAEVSHTKAGAKVVAPDVIKITENVSVGVEVGKDIMTDVLYQDTLTYLEDDYGWFGYLTVTIKGSLFDFTKK